jgi:dihydroorotase
VSMRLGLRGIPAAAEEVMVARDVALAELTGGRLHIAHVSTRGAIDSVRAAKARGVAVTAEAAPHHFSLTDAAVAQYDGDAKMNPPLRSEEHRQAVLEGLRDGTIDAIATDHAPHHKDEKEVEFENAAFGIVGLETALPLSLRLVTGGTLTPSALVERLSTAPARILRVPGGTLAEGSAADVTLVDPDAAWTVETPKLRSKSKNTPFRGHEMRGKAIVTIVGGRIVFDGREQ